jgi:hypothetical protein
VTLTVFNDTSDPNVTWTSPAGGTTVNGTITLSATATDNVGVTSVRFTVDGNTIGVVTSAPYQLSWSSLTVANGWHNIRAIARDAAGNTEDRDINIKVANDTSAPTVAVSSPATGATVGGTVTVTATASDDIGVTSVEFLVDGVALGTPDQSAPYAAAWSTAAASNGPHTLSAIARDAAGNVTTSTAVVVTVANDTTAPLVALTGLVPGAPVAGVVTLAAEATDDTAVASVQFFVDGVAVAPAMAAAPYQLGWDSASLADGAHTVTAVARDAAGNASTSAAITVMVANVTAPPGLHP